ncbi:hypothetical protein [Pseudomonas oryzihabitans]|uniref:hypothetical protein n=1 Tax=Pseudomonas oryzihabitans TaxID=47885 RepID=UPI0028B226E4|nr:hypothetical protein [Pseudomonas oryzihabitans]
MSTSIPRRPGATPPVSYPQLVLLAKRGHSIRQCAEIMGVGREALRAYAHRLGDQSPFSSRWVAQNWVRTSGETVVTTARRLAPTHTLIQVAKVIGYGDGCALVKALAVRGVALEFKPDPYNARRWARGAA